MSLYKLYHLRVLFTSVYEADLGENFEIASQQQVCVCQETAALDLSVRQLRASLGKKCTYFHHHKYKRLLATVASNLEAG
jgi:hypothetical protein